MIGIDTNSKIRHIMVKNLRIQALLNEAQITYYEGQTLTRPLNIWI